MGEESTIVNIRALSSFLSFWKFPEVEGELPKEPKHPSSARDEDDEMWNEEDCANRSNDPKADRRSKCRPQPAQGETLEEHSRFFKCRSNEERAEEESEEPFNECERREATILQRRRNINRMEPPLCGENIGEHSDALPKTSEESVLSLLHRLPEIPKDRKRKTLPIVLREEIQPRLDPKPFLVVGREHLPESFRERAFTPKERNEGKDVAECIRRPMAHADEHLNVTPKDRLNDSIDDLMGETNDIRITEEDDVTRCFPHSTIHRSAFPDILLISKVAHMPQREVSPRNLSCRIIRSVINNHNLTETGVAREDIEDAADAFRLIVGGNDRAHTKKTSVTCSSGRRSISRE
jgi:hypothetical protein